MGGQPDDEREYVDFSEGPRWRLFWRVLIGLTALAYAAQFAIVGYLFFDLYRSGQLF